MYDCTCIIVLLCEDNIDGSSSFRGGENGSGGGEEKEKPRRGRLGLDFDEREKERQTRKKLTVGSVD